MKHFYNLSAISTLAIATGLIVNAANAQSLSSATCTAPTVVATFDAAVSGIVTGSDDTIGAASATQSIPTTGLTALKFKKSATEADVVALDIDNGEWSSGNTVYTVRPTISNYREANDWDVWPVRLTATVSGTTSTVTCQ